MKVRLWGAAAVWAASVCGLFSPAWAAAPASGVEPAESGGGTVTYRCPNNDYRNTISPKEAEKLGCKKLEGAPISVIGVSKPRTGAAVPGAAGSGIARVDPSAQRARDSDARRILEQRVEDRGGSSLAALKKDYNNGQPERTGRREELPALPRSRWPR